MALNRPRAKALVQLVARFAHDSAELRVMQNPSENCATIFSGLRITRGLLYEIHFSLLIFDQLFNKETNLIFSFLVEGGIRCFLRDKAGSKTHY